ncbi:MAG: hypothetical protein JNL08_18310 [Planctomycetes bacterium]|nr:hypothetical protein [Planctomycetota bacterium]
MYRLAAEALDEKMECVECHRVFFPKTTAGKRVQGQDHTKTYMLMGGGALVLIVLFAVVSSSGGGEAPEQPKPAAERREVYTPGNHPRTAQIVKWAQAMAADNRLVIQTHNDVTALKGKLGVAGGDDNAIYAAIASHDSTRFLRELQCDSASLENEAAMSGATGRALVYVTPKPGNDDWKKNTRGELLVSFRMDGEQIKVTDWEVKMAPVRNPAKPDTSKTTFTPNENIAKPEMVDFVDSTGTARKKTESQPTAVPHWKDATPAQQQKADQIVADILTSADPEAKGGLFTRATLQVQTIEDRKAVVPRVLNAMFELYGDVNANNMKLSQLDRALMAFTGKTVGYSPENSGDAAKDKAARESCVRQWFAFWWRYSNGDLSEFLDLRENLDEPLEGEQPKGEKPKGPL